ncbi:putative non-specific serine/threonine protein kinase [Rosa chinensis]|uniref:Putative non-specific serine/threonine protein kinase n=1 Tax=Rosa chinensis TaxID=74649 RepID=A0A2P6SQ74_ROSCH|nr:putative non-specific serine/threonine protein kinase [Rosa chinensis]
MSIFSLRGLRALDLSSNNFSGSFPLDGLHQLRNLSALDLSHNNLNQSNLRILDLSDNQINGKVPNWIWGFSDLENLNLSCNSLDSVEVPSINHSNLLSLDFSRNYFSSSIPSTIGDVLGSTVFLSLSSNNLSGIIPESLCNSRNLRILDLSNNSLSGTVPRCLTTMSTLLVLNLRRNNLTNVNEFSHNCSLEMLDISGNQIQGQF